MNNMSKQISFIYNDVDSLRILKSIQHMKYSTFKVAHMISVDEKVSLKALEELTGAFIVRNHPTNKICIVRFY